MTLPPESVGMAEVKGSRKPVTFSCLGLGSCVGVCMLDSEANAAVVAHVMLPAAFAGKPVDQPGKFADTAIVEMKRMLESMGGQIARTRVCYAGGAQVFQFGSASASKLDIGARNIEAVEFALREYGFRVVAKDVGGASGRTLVFDPTTGSVRVKQFALGDKELCNLRIDRVKWAA
jgi:chemotaxis protein CheD